MGLDHQRQLAELQKMLLRAQRGYRVDGIRAAVSAAPIGLVAAVTLTSLMAGAAAALAAITSFS